MYVPEGEELDQVVEDYTKMGLPGCVGSMDVTHLMWKQCPSALRHVCTGRYHCPSVAFQMVCAHTRRIHHVSQPFYGATNSAPSRLSKVEMASLIDATCSLMCANSSSSLC